MAKDSAQRYQTCEALVEDARWAVGRPNATVRATPTQETMPASLYDESLHVAQTRVAPTPPASGQDPRPATLPPPSSDGPTSTPSRARKARIPILVGAVAATGLLGTVAVWNFSRPDAGPTTTPIAAPPCADS